MEMRWHDDMPEMQRSETQKHADSSNAKQSVGDVRSVSEWSKMDKGNQRVICVNSQVV